MIPALPGMEGTELLIGAKHIPQLARSLGTGTREFRKGISGDYEEVDANEVDQELPLEGDAPTQEVRQR
jgi:Sec-independent protein translocase protein TatA